VTEHIQPEIPAVTLKCNSCGKPTTPAYKDDSETQWYKCEDGHATSTPQKKRQYDKDDDLPMVLEHISNIESPSLIGKPVIVEAVISSTSVSYSVPSEVKATLKEEDQEPVVIVSEIIEVCTIRFL
jgi:hypothetical protein